MTFDQKKFAKKSLGQNFLNNPAIREKILEEAGDISGKNILEIGPGLGFLTTALIKAKANLTAVELDPRAIKVLNTDFGHNKNFKILNEDILKVDLDELYSSKYLPAGRQDYSIIANIPYNITNPIIRKITEKTKNKPEFSILMVQKEVGEKICLHKKTKRSILSIAVEVYAETKYCFTVPRTDFDPAPKVDSAIIKITTRPFPLITEELTNDFFTVVNGGFSEKRKKLSNVIGKFFGIPSDQLLGEIDGNRRAETLSVEEWIEITNNFRKLK